MTNTQFIYLTSWSDTLIWHPDLTPRSDIPIWHPDLTYWIRMGSGCWISITDPTSWSHIPSRYPDSALWSDTLIWHLIRHLDVKTFQIPCLIFGLDNKTWSDWLWVQCSDKVTYWAVPASWKSSQISINFNPTMNEVSPTFLLICTL